MQSDYCNMEDYHNIIRQMIKNEDEVRNQRTNWFLIIQGFLIAGLCSLCEKSDPGLLSLLISCIGLLVSFSFMYAAWRSTKAVTMAIVCWKLFLKDNKKVLCDYPPINLITKEIISHKTDIDDDDIGASEWNKKIFNRMYKGQISYIDKKINGLEFLLPYRFLPVVFMVLWIVIIIAFCCSEGFCELIQRI